MKKINFFFFSLFCFCYSVYSQDTIVKRNGDTLIVNIIKSTSEVVEFKYPNETILNEESKNSIAQIIYSSGRIENCETVKSLATINGSKDWQKVELTTNPDDVVGLTKLGEIVGKSSMTGPHARKKLKQSAAKIHAPIVLIQQEIRTPLGFALYGIAYK